MVNGDQSDDPVVAETAEYASGCRLHLSDDWQQQALGIGQCAQNADSKPEQY